jgi:hypothetical protein
MLRSLFSPASAHGRRRPVSVTHPPGILGAFGVSAESVQRAFRVLEREWSGLSPGAVLALQVTFGIAAAGGTVLALFAWSGVGLGAGL